MTEANTLILIGILGVALLLALIALVVAVRRDRTSELDFRLAELRQSLAQDGERLERELRTAVESTSAQVRVETSARLAEVQAGLTQQMNGVATMQGQQLLGFGQQVAKVNEAAEGAARANREESAKHLKDFATLMQQQLADMSRGIQNNLAELRATLRHQLLQLQQGNESKLDQMRATVDEKLQTTLETRLGESFRLVAERLEQVHKGLGEMQTLATGVGDLKRVLTNVKTRGSFGEVQLGALLEQVLTREQYDTNVATRPGSKETGRVRDQACQAASSRAGCRSTPSSPSRTTSGCTTRRSGWTFPPCEEAGRALENRIKLEARRIREKYVELPHTTDFALLFLPTEGLYAEVLRRPGLVDNLQREQRVIVTGPDHARGHPQQPADGVPHDCPRATLQPRSGKCSVR